MLGSSGFIGSHLYHRLRATGEVVVGLGRNGNSPSDFCLDTSDPHWLVRILKQKKVSVLVNTLGNVSSSPSKSLESEAWNEIRIGFEVAIEELGKLRRVIHLGSAAEYGRSQTPFKESDVPNPTDHYGESKLLESEFMFSLTTKGCRVTVVRPSSVLGLNTKGSMLLPSALRAITEGVKVTVRDPVAVRNYIYVEDLVDGLIDAIRKVDDLPVILNFGSTENLSIMSTLMALADAFGVPLEEFASGAHKGESREDSLRGLDVVTLDSSLALETLGWKAKTDLRSALTSIGKDLGIIR